MDRHFCVTVYIQHPTTKKFLLVLHRKLGLWVPPGGHVDPNELPDDAARREVFEETGVQIQLIGRGAPTPTCVTTPYGIQRNIIREEEHEHLDLIYRGTPISDADDLVLSERESLGIGWFDVSDITKEDFQTFASVRDWAVYFTSGNP